MNAAKQTRHRLLSGGVIGRDVVTIVRAESEPVKAAVWREARRAPAIRQPGAAEPAPTPAPEPAAAPPPPSVDLEAELEAAYNRGFAEGQAAASATAGATTERFEGAMAHLEAAMANLEKRTAHDIVELAVQLAESVARHAMPRDNEALEAAVSAALEGTSGDEPLGIRCDEETAAALKMQLDELVSTLGVPSIEVSTDPELDVGDLMLTRGAATIDERIRPRLEIMKRDVQRALGLS